MTATGDPTRAITSHDRDWIEVPHIPKGKAWLKVIHADPQLNKVVFKFRFSPGCELPPPTSGPGAELVVGLDSDDDQFLINHLPDGTDVPFDMPFFQAVLNAPAPG